MRKTPQPHYSLVNADYSAYLTSRNYLTSAFRHWEHMIIVRERSDDIVFGKERA
jgi:hypothetical protein